MKKIELEIIALSHSLTQTQSYAVILGEVNGLRKLPIVIGAYEAQAIAVAIEKISPNRPLTHDLMRNLMLATDIDLHEVIINNLDEGVFYAQLVCSNDKETVEIDSRTSDALALAIRFNAPIYIYEHILDNAGMPINDNFMASEAGSMPRALRNDDNDDTLAENTTAAYANKTTFKSELQNMSLEELELLLETVLEQEDYIKAASIRDEINTRK